MDFLKQKLNVNTQHGKIVGDLFTPNNVQSISVKQATPLLILAHGYEGDGASLAGYGRRLAENGIATYTFDFIGGSSASLSGGSTTNMSVESEFEELTAIYDYFIEQTGFNSTNIYVGGESQGGFVAAMLGNRRHQVAGLVLLYPAFIIPDMMQEQYPDRDHIPDITRFDFSLISRKYIMDAYDLDLYATMPEYHNPVLIMHGTADRLVPMRYSERAVATYPNARLVKFPGTGHGIYRGHDLQKAVAEITQLINGKQ